ncbi:MAG: aldo/keto reductase [Ignavibacteria bacterium]
MTTHFKTGTFKLDNNHTINRFGFGAMRITGTGIWGQPADKAESLRVLKRAVELGVNFIDTADAYGPNVSEELIAEALYPYPKDLIIATKGGLLRSGPGKWNPDCSPKHLREALEGSLKRLRKDVIDLYQLHTIDISVPVEDSVGTLADMQKEGKIRFVGVSNFKVSDLEKIKHLTNIVTVQNRYNLADRVDEPVLEYCDKHNIGYIPWFPLDMGNIPKGKSAITLVAKKYNATDAQIALAWLLKRSPVILPIPGTSKVAHLEENMKADEIELSDDDFKQLGKSYNKD